MVQRLPRSRALAFLAFVCGAAALAAVFLTRGGGEAATPANTAPSRSTSDSSTGLALSPVASPEAERSTVSAPSTAQRGAPAPEEIDATDLVVEIIDARGQLAPSGRLECFASDGEAPEVDEQARVQRVEFSNGSARLRLESELAHAYLVAFAVDGTSGAARVSRLRGAGPTHRASGRVEHAVRLELSDQPPTPRVWGSITVDGVARTPRGLRVQLHHAPLANAETLEAVRAREPKAARIDSLNSTYFVSPLSQHATGLWVRSEDCAPQWIALPSERHEGDLRLDIECSTGVVLELRCLNAVSGAPAAGARIYSEVLVTVATEPRRTTQRSLFGEHVADAQGVARIAGLPRQGRVRVRERAFASERATVSTADVLLELELTPQLENVVRRELRVGATPAAPVRVWGWTEELSRLSSSALEGAESVRVRIAARGDEAHVSRAFDAEFQPPQWNVSAPLNGRVRAWVECGGVRVSEHRDLDLSNAVEFGPVSFAALSAAARSLRWIDGVASSRLELRSASRGGLDDLAAWRLDGASGERSVAFPSDLEALDISLELPGGSRLRWIAPAASASQSTLVLDLAASRSRAIRIPALSGPEWGDVGIELLGVEGPAQVARVRCELPCRAGESLDALTLPPGEYAFRLAGSQAAVVCGFVRVDASSSGPVELPFAGARRWLDDCDPQRTCEIVVESVAGQARNAAGLESLLRFALPPSEQAPLVPNDFTYRRHTP